MFEKEKELLKSMNEISVKMRDTILLNYFDIMGNNAKYILSLCIDAFDSINVFCFTVQNVAIKQAGTILRLLLEEVSIIHILTKHQELLDKYVEHFKFRMEINSLDKNKQIPKISEKFNIKENRDALTYLDYGWIPCDKGNKYSNEESMIKYAGFSDIISWKKMYLDKLTHSSFYNNNFIGDTKFPIIESFIEISAKLFDMLCCDFNNYTKFDFVFDNINYFKNFRDNYEKFKL